MKALNQTERNNLYLKFLLLFIITVAITVFAIFFDYQLPAKLNAEQRQKLKYYNSFTVSQRKMLQLMDTLDNQIKELGNSSREWVIEKDMISKQINFAEFTGDTSTKSLTGKLDKTYFNLLESRIKVLKCKEDMEKIKENLANMKDESKSKEEMNEKLLEIERSKEKGGS